MSPERPGPAFRLLCVTDRRGPGPGGLEDRLERLCAAGLRGVEIREKDMDEESLLALAARLKPVLDGRGAQWMVNGPPELALKAGASGVHLPSTADVAAARALAGAVMLVGRSVHSPSGARDAAAAGADYIVFGPVYDTASKRPYGPPLGLSALREACGAAGQVPVYAIGGVTPERAVECLGAGARGVAVLSPLMGENRAEENLAGYERRLGSL
jgi:thiamine-phosphate pyrophosphorylase